MQIEYRDESGNSLCFYHAVQAVNNNGEHIKAFVPDNMNCEDSCSGIVLLCKECQRLDNRNIEKTIICVRYEGDYDWIYDLDMISTIINTSIDNDKSLELTYTEIGKEGISLLHDLSDYYVIVNGEKVAL